MSAPKGNNFAKGNRGGPGRTPIYSGKLLPIAKGMCEDGATEYEIADRLGISTRTLRWWRHEHKEFSAAMTLGREAMVERAKSSLYHRAVGYSYESEKVQIFSRWLHSSSADHRARPARYDGRSQVLERLDPETWRERTETKTSTRSLGPSSSRRA